MASSTEYSDGLAEARVHIPAARTTFVQEGDTTSGSKSASSATDVWRECDDRPAGVRGMRVTCQVLYAAFLVEPFLYGVAVRLSLSHNCLRQLDRTYKQR